MKDVLPKFIGSRVRRREDPALLRGEGRFVADFSTDGAAAMTVVRSPFPHAELRGIDTSRAVAMKGVVAVLTAADVNPHVASPLPALTGSGDERFMKMRVPERWPLTEGRVRHVGDAVAVVVAETPFIAADAVEAVEVDYQALPAVAGPVEALAKRAPRVHESLPDNRAFVWQAEGGSVDTAFARAKVTVELPMRIQRMIPNAMEPRAVAAVFDPDTDGFTVLTTTQIPHMVRRAIAASFEVPEERVRVIAPEVGGGFGAKANVYPEEILVPFLARKLGRPIRWVASRGEDYLATVHGRDQHAVMRLAATNSGRVVAADLEVTVDLGAYYSRVSALIATLTGTMMTGVYDIPNARATATGVLTNKVPTEPYRGAGRPEACYVLERAMDALARKLDMDPAELRRRNFVSKERFPYQTALGLEYDSGDYGQALDAALKRASYEEVRREQERRRHEGGPPLGIGISSYVEICGFGPWETGTVSIDARGRATVLTGTSPTGQGHETTWAQIAADALQIPIDHVTVKHGDTAVVKKGTGTFGSRSTPVGGSAVLSNARAVTEGAKGLAAFLLEAASADIRLTEGRFHVVGVPSRSVGWEEVAATGHHKRLPRVLRGQLHSDEPFTPKGETFPFGAHLCIVQLDPETGEITILRYVSVDDCGRVINPLLVEGQVHGGLAQGIGQALWEGAIYDESANLLSGSLMDYAVPRADQLPTYETYRTVTPSPLNALGVKGIGEAATIGSTPAVVNAVIDALSPYGVQHIDTPLTAEKVWRAMNSRYRGAGTSR